MKIIVVGCGKIGSTLVEELAEKGLVDGVECHHPRGTVEQNERSAQIARHYGLIRTGGTDFHGARTSSPNPIGTCITTEENITALFGRVKKYNRKDPKGRTKCTTTAM